MMLIWTAIAILGCHEPFIASVERRVERWRGGWKKTLAMVASPFGNQLPVSFRQPSFHLPLVEPDRRISRIRLSDGIRETAR